MTAVLLPCLNECVILIFPSSKGHPKMTDFEPWHSLCHNLTQTYCPVVVLFPTLIYLCCLHLWHRVPLWELPSLVAVAEAYPSLPIQTLPLWSILFFSIVFLFLFKLVSQQSSLQFWCTIITTTRYLKFHLLLTWIFMATIHRYINLLLNVSFCIHVTIIKHRSGFSLN